MVTSDEISQRLRNKREGNSSNGYLVCNSCGGYYELQPGESWTDFDTQCECGGQLVHSAINSLVSSDSSLAEEEFEHKRYQLEILIAYIAFFLFWPISFILAIYLVTRDNQRAKFHGKLLLVLSIIPVLLIAIWGLLIYQAYFSQPDISPIQDNLETVRSTRLFVTCFLNLPV